MQVTGSTSTGWFCGVLRFYDRIKPFNSSTETHKQLISVAAYEEYAKEKLDARTLGYYLKGAGEDYTLKRNIKAYESWQCIPHIMRSVFNPNTSTNIAIAGTGSQFDFQFNLPVGISPFAVQGLAHPDGELATAKAAKLMRVPMIVPMLATRSIEEVAMAAGPDAVLWFQLYWLVHDDSTFSLVRRAESSGYKAIVITGDVNNTGKDRPGEDIRNNSAAITFPNFENDANISQILAGSGSLDQRVSSIFKTQIDWKNVKILSEFTKLPVIVKGIMNASDAVFAITHGASGIIISNSGGRTLEGSPATIEVLPEICSAVKDTNPFCQLFIDGGIRRGRDVYKALALGADMVFVGRPIIFGLTAKGSDGAHDVLKIFQRELVETMQFAGIQSIEELRNERIHRNLLRHGKSYFLTGGNATTSSLNNTKKKTFVGRSDIHAFESSSAETVANLETTSSSSSLNMFGSLLEQVKLAKAADDLGDELVSESIPILHNAALSGHKETVKYLLDKGMDPNQTNEKGRTALLYATFIKDDDPDVGMEMVKFLKSRGAKTGIKDVFGYAAVDYRLFFEQMGARFRTRMKHIEIANDGMDSIDFLLKQMSIHVGKCRTNIEPERQEIMGGALEAIDSDFTDLQLAVRDSKFMLVLTLISQRVNLNAKSHFGRTAAMSIRKNDYSPKIYQLMTLEEGIDTELRDLFGFTAGDYLRASM